MEVGTEMTNGARATRIAAVILMLGAVLGAVMPDCASGARVPDMVPMPKKYEQTGGVFELSGTPTFIEKGNRQCEIAAHEIALRIKELGGTPGDIKPVGTVAAPGIYVLPVTSAAARHVARGLRLKVSADDPGPQGYVIETTRDRLVIVGSDNVGALYGAMTVRQMMESAAGGRVVITAARVYDKPDYRYRHGPGFLRGLGHWAKGEGDALSAYKAGFDWLMRFKINMVADYKYSPVDVRALTPGRRGFIRQANAYAIERGIYPILQVYTNVGDGRLDKAVEFRNWDCVRGGERLANGKRHRLFCWSRDELAMKTIGRIAKFCKECDFRALFLHPVDGGGLQDPELWNKRCARCRARWKDDERWKASVHQLNLWGRILKRTVPRIRCTSPIYPYHASQGSYDHLKKRPKYKNLTKQRWQMNTLDYWRKVHRGLDWDVIPMTWAAERAQMDTYRECFKGRPICIYGYSCSPLGYFGTWHRMNKSNYYGHPEDIFFLAGGFHGPVRWMNYICSCEFTWNTHAPGHEEFREPRYAPDRDHDGPKIIMQEWVPRATRAFFGREVGSRIAPIYQAGVQPYLIEKPHSKRASWCLRRPIPTERRLADQVRTTREALRALQEAHRYVDTLDKYRRKTFMYYYEMMPRWHKRAKEQHASCTVPGAGDG